MAEPRPNRRTTALLLTGAYSVVAILVITNFDFRLIAPEKLSLVFNDMARRLLAWDFTIDPAVIQYEAFLRDGHTYTYYGFFPALLRMPMVLAGYGSLEVGRISCLVALTLTVYPYLRLFQAALPRKPGGRQALSWAILLSVVLTGPQLYLLASASLYHELIFWSAALTAWFNLIVLRPWLAGEELPASKLPLLALLAGLDLWCRFTAGAALLLTLLLLLCRAALSGRPGSPKAPQTQRWSWPTVSMGWLLRLAGVGCLALLLVAVLGVVNQERWGEWWDSAPLQYYNQFQASADNTERFARHGLFSLVRVGLAVAYYTAGIKLETTFPQLFYDYYGDIEGPRAIVSACAPLTFGLMFVGIAAVLRRPATRLVPLLLAAGQLVGVIVTLGFLALTLRYTFDHWGFVTVLAAVGVHRLTRNGEWIPSATSRVALWCAVLLLSVGAVASAGTLLRYKIVYSGTAPEVRYSLSRTLQPLVCPHAPTAATVDLHVFNPLVTPKCPPFW